MRNERSDMALGFFGSRAASCSLHVADGCGHVPSARPPAKAEACCCLAKTAWTGELSPPAQKLTSLKVEATSILNTASDIETKSSSVWSGVLL